RTSEVLFGLDAGAVADRHADSEHADRTVGAGSIRRADRHAAGKHLDLSRTVLRAGFGGPDRSPRSGSRIAASDQHGLSADAAATGARVSGEAVHAAARSIV